jgi:hypothetical protein
MATGVASSNLALDKMKSTDRIQKKWMVQQLQRVTRLKTLAGIRNYQKAILNMLLSDGGDRTEAKSVRKYLSFPPNDRSVVKLCACLYILPDVVDRRGRHCHTNRGNLRIEVLGRAMGTV